MVMHWFVVLAAIAVATVVFAVLASAKLVVAVLLVVQCRPAWSGIVHCCSIIRSGCGGLRG